MSRGIFITFEGGEGSGKSTVIKALEKKLSSDYEILLTREPGGIKISEEIRQVILDKKNVEMDSITEAMLYAASRRQHLVERIIPALQNGKVVLCDRFVDSSLAYQGYARKIGIEKVFDINKLVIENYMPDLTILIECPPVVGLRRINGNEKREINRLDLENIEFHQRVQEGYNILKNRFKNRYRVVDGTKLIDEVIEECYKIIKEYVDGVRDN